MAALTLLVDAARTILYASRECICTFECRDTMWSLVGVRTAVIPPTVPMTVLLVTLLTAMLPPEPSGVHHTHDVCMIRYSYHDVFSESTALWRTGHVWTS